MQIRASRISAVDRARSGTACLVTGNATILFDAHHFVDIIVRNHTAVW